MKHKLFALILVAILFLPQILGAELYEESAICGPEAEVCIIEENVESENTELDDLLNSMQHDEDKVCILYFYSPTCSHCQNIKPLIREMHDIYGRDSSISLFDVSNPKNVAIYNQLCRSKEYTGNEIPLLAINDVVLVGENEIKDKLEAEIKRGMNADEKICPLAGMSCHDGESGGTEEMLAGVKGISFFAVLPLVLITGLGDGINPCAFAVLLFIMAFLQEISGSKKRLKRVTISYIISFMIINIGLGIFYYFTSIQIGHPTAIRYTAIGFAAFAGIINTKDFFAYGKGFSLEIPKFSKKYIESLAAKASVPAAMIMGSLVALLEAPCSVPIYLTVLEVLKGQGKTIMGVFPYILIYNIMFILPIVVLSLFIYYGAEAKALEGWRQKHRKFMKLSLGLILLFLAGLMAFGVI